MPFNLSNTRGDKLIYSNTMKLLLNIIIRKNLNCQINLISEGVLQRHCMTGAIPYQKN